MCSIFNNANHYECILTEAISTIPYEQECLFNSYRPPPPPQKKKTKQNKKKNNKLHNKREENLVHLSIFLILFFYP